MTCPEREELLRLIDGEVTENRAAELRVHAAECPRCSAEIGADRALVARLAAPIPGVSSYAAASAVMRRLDPAAPASSSWRARWMLPAGWLAAAAAALAVVVWLPQRGGDAGGFQSRGGAAKWSARVGVELWVMDGGLRQLAPGAAVAPGSAFVASYANLDTAPAYLLAFAIDAAGEVHWLYPAFVDAATDPKAVRLAPSASRRALQEAVVLDGVATGPLRCVLVVAREPLHVSSIEQLPRADRELDRLRARWPGARVEEVVLRVAPQNLPPP